MVNKHEELVKRSKYGALHDYLRQIQSDVWETSFVEIETILGFGLPPSARLHWPWWGNQKTNNGHSQALAWGTAGWDTSDVNMEKGTLVFKRKASTDDDKLQTKEFNLDEFWPPHDFGPWPQGLVIDREFIYGDRA